MTSKADTSIQRGDWVSFEHGGIMFRDVAIGVVQGTYPGGLEVLCDGQRLNLPVDAVREWRRARK